MKTIIDKSSSRGYFDHDWLKTYHTFSFADYYNRERMHFGALRVINDDIIAPMEGFDTHPHKNMEVITIPLEGYLRHGDSMKNSHVITPGDIQVMSAGTGIYHSEFNASETEYLKLLQIWVIPKQMNTKPEYNNFDIRNLLHKNELSLFISPDGETPASILQDAWFSMGDLDKNIEKNYKIHSNKNGIYVFVISGKVHIGDDILLERDGIGIWDTEYINIKTDEKSVLLLMEVPVYE